MKNKYSLFVVTLLLISIMQSGFVPQTVAAGEGWLTGWDYRRTVDINGSAGAGTDYQVSLNVLYDPDMQTDFDDVRFTDGDGITELDYWVEYYNATAPTIELADYGEISDESSSPDYILTNVKDGSAFNETSATDIEIWFEVDTTNGFEGFSYAHYLDVDSGTDCDLAAYNFDTDLYVKIDEPLPPTYDWMNGTIYDSDYWNTTHIAFSVFELSGTADFYWDYGEVTHSKTARVWVNVTDNLDTDQTIYMYYGNDAVSTTSDGDATFLMYEDWTSESVRGAVWDIIDSDGSLTYSAVDANHGTVAKFDADAGLSYKITTDFDTSAPIAIMLRANMEEASVDNGVRFGSGHDGDFGFALIETTSTGEQFYVYDDDANQDSQAMTNAYCDTWVTFQITRDGTNTKLYADTILIETASWDPDIVTTNPAVSLKAWDSEDDLYSDWIAVRKYITTEPVFDAFGDEETEPPVLSYSWVPVDEADFVFPVVWNPAQQFGYDAFFIFLGLIMIPLSTMYLVRGGRNEMNTDKLFFGLIIFVLGLGFLIGGILP